MAGWHHWHNGHEFKQTREIVKDGECWHVAVYGITKSGTRLRNWTATMKLVQYWSLLLTLILSNSSYQAHSWSIPSSHIPWLISDLDRFVNSFLRGAPLSPPPRKHHLLPTLWSPWVDLPFFGLRIAPGLSLVHFSISIHSRWSHLVPWLSLSSTCCASQLTPQPLCALSHRPIGQTTCHLHLGIKGYQTAPRVNTSKNELISN